MDVLSYGKAAATANNLSQITNDGQINGFVVLTQTAYDALPAGKLTDGKVYMIVGA
jgi:hypothetical protein